MAAPINLTQGWPGGSLMQHVPQGRSGGGLFDRFNMPSQNQLLLAGLGLMQGGLQGNPGGGLGAAASGIMQGSQMDRAAAAEERAQGEYEMAQEQARRWDEAFDNILNPNANLALQGSGGNTTAMGQATAAGVGVPSSAALRQRFAMAPGGPVAPSGAPQVAGGAMTPVNPTAAFGASQAASRPMGGVGGSTSPVSLAQIAQQNPGIIQLARAMGPQAGGSMLADLLQARMAAQARTPKQSEYQQRLAFGRQIGLQGDDLNQFAMYGKPAEAPGGTFEGTGMEAQAMNILLEGDPNSPEYAAAYARQAQPKISYDAATGQQTIITPDMSWARPPGGGGRQTAATAAPQDQEAPQQAAQGGSQTIAQAPGLEVQQVGQPKYTKEEKDAATFASRMEMANTDLPDFSDAGADFWGGTGQGFLPRNMQSEEYQRFKRAEAAFVNSVLRRESGAAIRDDEFINTAKEYWPQPGDSLGVLEDKRRARELAIANMRMGAGRAPIQEAEPAKKPENAETPDFSVMSDQDVLGFDSSTLDEAGTDAYLERIKRIGRE